MTPFRDLFGIAGYVIEAVGVISIIVGFVLSTIWFVSRLRRLESLDAYQKFRQDLARSIILGLEFLITGDIIRTGAVRLTRTGLSWPTTAKFQATPSRRHSERAAARFRLKLSRL